MPSSALTYYHAPMNEDRILLAQAEDLIGRCRARDIMTHTGFLDAAQQSMLRRAFGVRQSEVRLSYFGGYEEADRVLLVCLPYYMDTPPGDLLTVIRATVPRGSSASVSGRKLTHSDYLGALMGLGIERRVLGDILVREDGADILVLSDMADYLLRTFVSAGRAHLSLEKVDITELIVPEVSFREIHDTVASLRLDALLASAFRLSRGKAQEAVKQGLVFVDHIEAVRADLPIEEGAELVVRHLGKAKLLEIGGKSRKDRINVTIARYDSR